MREINLDRLRTLLAVADLGSFAAAAKALHLAPPTVTLRVAQLEARLGTRLLHRAPAGVTATSAGGLLMDKARRLLAEADDLLQAAQSQIAARGGRVRLGASTGALAHLLPQALEALAAQHPEIDVQVAVMTSEEALARLAAGSLDIGIVALPQPARRGLRVQAWRQDPVLAFIPAAWEPPRHVPPAWLAARPLIANDRGTRLSRQTAEWFAEAGERPQARIELNYNDAMKSLVAAGYGAALLPHEAGAPPPDRRISTRPLRPAMSRALGIAHRTRPHDDATEVTLQALLGMKER
ncbi:MAG: LysR family transcriptional regulator [Polaromonas sp.]|uniref:LysR family transcriptional regulator n=1 Tax=Polaromonas sp. TaxID=1869339 RepID=UPI00180FB22A|nr:LysR family transcriptional regulator [Polaromonas sp.]MBA3592842.1 LysR family transcriptional regulator [Polaromonas sp.]